MKKFRFSIPALILVVTLTILQSCQKEEPAIDQNSLTLNSEIRTEYTNIASSQTYIIEKGNARAWIAKNYDGTPAAVGVTISRESLKGLPNSPTKYVLSFPQDERNNFYTHVLITWDPNTITSDNTKMQGQVGVYFYIIPLEERLAIGPNDMEKFENAPEAKYIPPAYYLLPGGTAQIGAQWADMLSSNLYGSIDTRTLNWGSYDGSFIYWAPKFTLEYLMTKPDEQLPLRQPEAFQRNGFYAERYSIRYSEKTDEYIIALEKLTYRNGE